MLSPSMTTRNPNEVLLALIQSMSDDLRSLSEKVKADIEAITLQQAVILRGIVANRMPGTNEKTNRIFETAACLFADDRDAREGDAVRALD